MSKLARQKKQLRKKFEDKFGAPSFLVLTLKERPPKKMPILTLPGLCESDIVAIASTIANEGVLALAVGVSACRSCFGVAPVEISA